MSRRQSIFPTMSFRSLKLTIGCRVPTVYIQCLSYLTETFNIPHHEFHFVLTHLEIDNIYLIKHRPTHVIRIHLAPDSKIPMHPSILANMPMFSEAALSPMLSCPFWSVVLSSHAEPLCLRADPAPPGLDLKKNWMIVLWGHCWGIMNAVVVPKLLLDCLQQSCCSSHRHPSEVPGWPQALSCSSSLAWLLLCQAVDRAS
jgi:hypothetical protein